MSWIGDFLENSTHHHHYNTNDGDGASITKSTPGTLYAIKDGNFANKVSTGISETEVATGVWKITMVLTNAFYAIGSDYAIYDDAAVIDTQTVNNAIVNFSIENRTSSKAAIQAAILAIIGITEGGTWTWQKIMKIVVAWTAGNWRVKSTDSTVQELLDAEDGTTVILEQALTRAPGAGSNYRAITVKI